MIHGNITTKRNGYKVPLGVFRVNYGGTQAMVDRALDCDVSYADIVSAEMRAVDREVSGRLAVRPAKRGK